MKTDIARYNTSDYKPGNQFEMPQKNKKTPDAEVWVSEKETLSAEGQDIL